MQRPRSSDRYAATLSLVPGPVLAGLVRLLMHGMRRRHAGLVKNFGRLDRAVVHIAPTDLPHRFAIAFGGGRLDVRVLLAADPPPADATIRGSLRALIGLLEGRIDGDSLFFSRDIEIAGSTAIIVAVRNTLDREDILLRDEIAAVFGPLARPVRLVPRLLNTAIGRSRARISAIHAGLHAADAPVRDVGAECDALRGEVKALKTRLAKLEVRRLRPDPAAAGSP